MNLALLYPSNALFRAMLKTLVFGLSSFAAIFCASAGYGLLKMLLPVFNGAAPIGIAEFSTHGGLTILFFVFAVIGAYVAKKCFW
jgi:hypothetical protein